MCNFHLVKHSVLWHNVMWKLTRHEKKPISMIRAKLSNLEKNCPCLLTLKKYNDYLAEKVEKLLNAK